MTRLVPFASITVVNSEAMQGSSVCPGRQSQTVPAASSDLGCDALADWETKLVTAVHGQRTSSTPTRRCKGRAFKPAIMGHHRKLHSLGTVTHPTSSPGRRHGSAAKWAAVVQTRLPLPGRASGALFMEESVYPFITDVVCLSDRPRAGNVDRVIEVEMLQDTANCRLVATRI
jgi:hypothetical protein